MKMMKQILTGVAVAALVITAGAHLSTAADGMSAPTGEITINAGGKKPARFNHSTHVDMGLECARCHGDAAPGPLGLDKKTGHSLCKECHGAGYNGKTGPTKCNDCHIKKRKAIEGC